MVCERCPRVKPRRSGFTLVELMIVITIISLLLSILIPTFQRARWQGQLAACQSNERNLATALETYNNPSNGGMYPDTLSVLTVGPSSYINSLPRCPTNVTVDYKYTVDGANKNDAYTLACEGGAHHFELDYVSAGFPQLSSANAGIVFK